MNQILCTKIKNKHKTFFKIQFTISIIILIILITSIFYYMLYLQKQEKLSNNLIDTYSIYQLYSNYSEPNTSDNISLRNEVFGIIEIPKINIYYPVFSHLNEELLKISPCKFYGDSPKVNSNICIAGHNYNNSMFFSNLSLININDEIYIYDNYGQKYVYKVFKSYEVHESDLSPIFEYDQSSKELTLITCNNLNNNRLIVKANSIK